MEPSDVKSECGSPGPSSRRLRLREATEAGVAADDTATGKATVAVDSDRVDGAVKAGGRGGGGGETTPRAEKILTVPVAAAVSIRSF